jgi:hypothetical protein
MKPIVQTVALVCLFATTSLAQEWQTSVDKHGVRKAQVLAEGATPDGEAKTVLTIQCSSGTGSQTSIIYSVMGADKMQRFSFDDFEGPDAVAIKKKLTTFQVVFSAGEGATEKTAVTGYFAESDTFAFELSAKLNDAGTVSHLIEAMTSPSATKIKVTVEDNRNAKRTLQTEFPVTGAAGAIKETMKGCGVSKPRLRKTA